MKSIYEMKTKMCLVLLTVLLSSVNVFAQLGYSSAAMSMSKMNAQKGILPTPNQVIVEEYINFHKHNIRTPKKGEPVALDITWLEANNNDIIMQVGISTGQVENLEDIPPVNVCLVLDRSGSMRGDRIAKAKDAAIEFVKRLREKDIVSIVIFDHEIDVLLPAQQVTDKQKIIGIIKSIEARGSTDLNSGLICGYKEVLEKYDNKYNNKVIMLTDAITNTGTVDPMQIVKNSSFYSNEKTIDITMIGFGVDFNAGLSRQLSSNHNSSIFFINDSEDLTKVFVDEIESLLSPVGKNVSLEIEIGSSFEIEKFYGYNPIIHNNKVSLKLDNMNSGLTQVFLIKVNPKTDKARFNASATLSFYNIGSNENVNVIEKANYGQKSDFSEIEDLKKNFDIAFMAQTLKDMAELCQQKNYKQAQSLVSNTLQNTLRIYPALSDKDIKRIYDILKDYEKTLDEYYIGNIAGFSYPY